MKKLIISVFSLAMFCSCFAGTQSEIKAEQNEWLSGQNAILFDQLADTDGMWLADQTEILLEQLESQLESIDNG